MKSTSNSKLKSYELPQNNGRLCYIDNIRFVLILLVVCGHFIEYGHVFPGVFKFIYMFHMPAFIFLNGYVTKENVRVEKKIGYLILYVVSVVLFWAFKKYFLGGDVKLTFFNPNPYTGLWYLLALFIWSLIFPIFVSLKPAVAVMLSLLLGLLAGFDDSVGQFLSLSRIIVFFPFYLLGYYAKEYKWLEKLKSFKLSAFIAAVVVIFFMFVAIKYKARIPKDLLVSKKSYSKMGMGYIDGITYRSLFYIFAAILGCSVFMLVPKCKMFFTTLGQNTIAIYLLHLLMIIYLSNTGMLANFTQNYSPYWVFLAVIIVTFFFAIPFWSKPFNYILSAKYVKFIEKDKR